MRLVAGPALVALLDLRHESRVLQRTDRVLSLLRFRRVILSFESRNQPLSEKAMSLPGDPPNAGGANRRRPACGSRPQAAQGNRGEAEGAGQVG